mmetsp:Transcript_15134/g.27886  ORF Transcript_15134/g.27886 Transcript_15134/m.27886 type:complete len:102 (-) Transcript_15134:18-323(-)
MHISTFSVQRKYANRLKTAFAENMLSVGGSRFKPLPLVPTSRFAIRRRTRNVHAVTNIWYVHAFTQTLVEYKVLAILQEFTFTMKATMSRWKSCKTPKTER